MLSHVLDTVVSASSLRPAHVIGYSLELWGQYQALVDGNTGSVVEGAVYEVQSEEDEARLAHYETNAYRLAPCYINLAPAQEGVDPEQVSGKTFKYAGDPEALREKRWDRTLWVRNMGSELKVEDRNVMTRCV